MPNKSPYAIHIDLERGEARYHFRDADDVVVSRQTIAQRIRDRAMQEIVADAQRLDDAVAEKTAHVVGRIDELDTTGAQKKQMYAEMKTRKWKDHARNVVADEMAESVVRDELDTAWESVIGGATSEKLIDGMAKYGR